MKKKMLFIFAKNISEIEVPKAERLFVHLLAKIEPVFSTIFHLLVVSDNENHIGVGLKSTIFNKMNFQQCLILLFSMDKSGNHYFRVGNSVKKEVPQSR